MGDFFSPVTNPVSRKQRRCDVCSAFIEPGTRYTKWAGRHEGDFFSGSAHDACYAAAAEADNDYDSGLMQVSDYSPEEALEVYHTAGALAEALPYLRTVMDFTDTPLDGKDDAAIVAHFDRQAAEQLALDLERIGRHFGVYRWTFDRLDARLRGVARKHGLWKDGALTEKGQDLAAEAKPRNIYAELQAKRAGA